MQTLRPSGSVARSNADTSDARSEEFDGTPGDAGTAGPFAFSEVFSKHHLDTPEPDVNTRVSLTTSSDVEVGVFAGANDTIAADVAAFDANDTDASVVAADATPNHLNS